MKVRVHGYMLMAKVIWENTTPAPLPRREYTIRSDYNLTMRGNRHEITKYGWLHDQDNSKIKRVMGKDDLIIAKEKGYNTYKKVNDNRCSVAKKWWIDNSKKWAIVRSKWEQIFNKKVDLYLKPTLDNRALYIYLFDDKIMSQEMKIILLFALNLHHISIFFLMY